ncbi:MAG TPA: hypothetical protein VF092_28955 [Longimicrobium sp.]
MEFNEARLLDNFGKLMQERIVHGTHTTEDAVRYMFFHTLVCAGYRPENISLEEPLPDHPTRRLDTVVYDRSGHRQILVEFKFHRMKQAVQPKPQLAGGLYRDLFRLAFAQAKTGAKAFLVYITDRGMADYLEQPKHGCSEIFLLAEESSVDIGSRSLHGKSKTFSHALDGFLYPATVRCAYRREFSNGQQLIIFSIKHLRAEVYEWD